MKPIKQSELYDAILDALGVEPRKAGGRSSRRRPRRRRRGRCASCWPKTASSTSSLAVGLLERHGHRVTIANNGRQALDLASGDDFDVILMDVQMPEMDGLEATRPIREHERQTGRHVPIIAMTAHALKGDRERCLAAAWTNMSPSRSASGSF